MLTLKRIHVILKELHEAGSVHLSTLLRAIDFTQDEHLRFHLWESAQTMLRTYMSYEFLLKLEEPGKHYGLEVGEGIASLWDNIDIKALITGIAVQDAHLEQAAAERYEPAHDVEQHWQNLDKEGTKLHEPVPRDSNRQVISPCPAAPAGNPHRGPLAQARYSSGRGQSGGRQSRQ